MPRADRVQVGRTRTALVSALVALRDSAPDPDARRHRQRALDCARWANAQFSRYGRFGQW